MFNKTCQPTYPSILDGISEVLVDGESDDFCIELGENDRAFHFWSMGGESLDYSDINVLAICQLK